MCTCTSCSADLLRVMAANSGWLEEGGRVVRNLDGDAVGVTRWIGQPEWARGFGMSQAEIQAAVDKAIAGRRLGKRQEQIVSAMLGEIADMRGEEKASKDCSLPARPAEPSKARQHFPALDRQRGAGTIYTMLKKTVKPVPRGRPRVPGRRVVVKLPEELIARAKALGGGGKQAIAEGVRVALRQSSW